MIRVLIAAAVALTLSLVIGPRFIEFLRRNEFGQQIREEGPQHHFAKQGVPTMGGLLILFAATVAFLPVSHFRLQSLTVLFTALACGAIGFLDDFIKLTHKRSLGLPGRWKLLLLAGVTVVVAIVAHHLHLSTDVYIPVIDVSVPLSYGWYVFLFFVIAGAANGTNLADGVDGLLAGTGIIALFTFMAMNVVSYVRSGPAGHRNLTKLDLAIVGAALIGAAVGFLWFNAFPAEVIMGDTGSMAFGGALAAFAIMMKVEVLLLFIGGIFVIEALSVMIQVFSFKRFGRRVFLMAPIHHHFEMKAWSETKITVRFWIVGGLLCAVGFALYYRYYFPAEAHPPVSSADVRAGGARRRAAGAGAGRARAREAARSRWERTSGSATAGSTSCGRRSTSSRSCSGKRMLPERAASRTSWARRRCCRFRTGRSRQPSGGSRRTTGRSWRRRRSSRGCCRRAGGRPSPSRAKRRGRSWPARSQAAGFEQVEVELVGEEAVVSGRLGSGRPDSGQVG